MATEDESTPRKRVRVAPFVSVPLLLTSAIDFTAAISSSLQMTVTSSSSILIILCTIRALRSVGYWSPLETCRACKGRGDVQCAESHLRRGHVGTEHITLGSKSLLQLCFPIEPILLMPTELCRRSNGRAPLDTEQTNQGLTCTQIGNGFCARSSRNFGKVEHNRAFEATRSHEKSATLPMGGWLLLRHGYLAPHTSSLLRLCPVGDEGQEPNDTPYIF